MPRSCQVTHDDILAMENVKTMASHDNPNGPSYIPCLDLRTTKQQQEGSAHLTVLQGTEVLHRKRNTEKTIKEI